MCEKERKRKREQAVVCDSVNTQLCCTHTLSSGLTDVDFADV